MLTRLARYFDTPSTEGFSAYRTGSAVHMMFSLAVAFGVLLAAAWLAGGPPGLGALGAAAAAPVALWGAGVAVGVRSHYNPLYTVALLGMIVAGLVFAPEISLPALVAAGAGQILGTAISKVLGRLAPPDTG